MIPNRRRSPKFAPARQSIRIQRHWMTRTSQKRSEGSDRPIEASGIRIGIPVARLVKSFGHISDIPAHDVEKIALSRPIGTRIEDQALYTHPQTAMGYKVPTTESARWPVQIMAIAAHPVATAQRPICHARLLI